MCRWKVSVDDVLQRHGTPSQTEPTSTPEAIWTSNQAVDPSEKYQCTGIVLTLNDRGSQGLGCYLGESMATRESHYGK